ncbi:hypothetical protein FACS1894178_3500 [Bacteroidia bacterium]|nr:hypothetical protein FACS1894178_3500 [Bacteroidia bacterium]
MYDVASPTSHPQLRQAGGRYRQPKAQLPTSDNTAKKKYQQIFKENNLEFRKKVVPLQKISREYGKEY